jgi:hypothetical protein
LAPHSPHAARRAAGQELTDAQVAGVMLLARLWHGPGGSPEDLEVAYAQALAYAEDMGLDALERTQVRTTRQAQAYAEYEGKAEQAWRSRVTRPRRPRRPARPPAANTRQWARSSAAQLIYGKLKHGQPRLAKPILTALEREGYSLRTIRRAMAEVAEAARVETIVWQRPARNRPAKWRLPKRSALDRGVSRR